MRLRKNSASVRDATRSIVSSASLLSVFSRISGSVTLGTYRLVGIFFIAAINLISMLIVLRCILQGPESGI